jgi:hypothetical protein
MLAACCSLFMGTLTYAQFGDDPEVPEALPNGIRFGEQLTQRWKVGMTIQAPAGPCGGVRGTAPIPTDWPEQSVRIVEEDFSPHVDDVDYRTLNNGVRQMVVSIRMIPANETAHAYVTLEVARWSILPPEDPSQFEIPSRIPKELRPFLGSSPKIETRDRRIRAKAREIVQGKETAWEMVEAMYDWVRDNVEYRNGELKGALAALRDGYGDCEELTSLFIAFCRCNRIPARTVWVPGHCYPEFYLQDQEGNGHWIPCQAAGTRDFGGMPDFRPVLQKGDNFTVPEKRGAQRYVAEHLEIKAVRGAGKPQVSFVRKLLPAD